ncbi:hypothetical protein NB16F79_39110 [Escherichia coli]
MEMYFKRMKDEWTGLVEQADPLIRAKAAEIAVAHAHYLSIEFYRIVRIDPHAEEFLSNEQVERQLKSAMERWIINVLSAQVDDVERLIQIQHTVAEVHARIGIPVEIVEMGFRVLKKILYPVIFSSDYSAAEKLQVYHFSINSIDIAMEVMTRAFTFSDSSASKEDENYRIFSLLENAEEEKERQIASILSWEFRCSHCATGCRYTGRHLRTVQKFKMRKAGQRPFVSVMARLRGSCKLKPRQEQKPAPLSNAWQISVSIWPRWRWNRKKAASILNNSSNLIR